MIKKFLTFGLVWFITSGQSFPVTPYPSSYAACDSSRPRNDSSITIQTTPDTLSIEIENRPDCTDYSFPVDTDHGPIRIQHSYNAGFKIDKDRRIQSDLYELVEWPDGWCVITETLVLDIQEYEKDKFELIPCFIS